jgi:CBS domain containing-hemolysin-like protein
MMSLERLLDAFLSRHAHLALVADEYGGAAGIVTLDNVIEELVGEIQDEFDAEQPEVDWRNANEFVIRGRFPLHKLSNLIKIEIEHTDVSTIGGYITALLGHLPTEGETVRIDRYLATVTKCDRRRVRRVKFRRAEQRSTLLD